ncbi:MAB_1171c family putative transporter [Streptomyces sp. NRRL S-87]|uniref:MAB_1171c family putative transporter n=1 Tax=Streptomyces sp. NRRL S-87 TaxID=1463920 RepID=UPI0007C48B68|nr:MAB_1171c family putative transporter [Streptomyces sp. NRRL S-87]
MGANGLDMYVPAAALALAFACKLPGLVQDWRNPLLRAVCILLLVASSVFFFAAPPTISTVNRITGVPNFSAPLVYCILTTFSACCLLLINHWRGGPPEHRRRISLLCGGVYAAVTAGLIVLFALGDAPVERLRDLDTYYANTPFIREMIVLYLVAHTVGAVVMTMLCLRWSLRVHGWLRAGLRMMVSGFFLDIGFDIVKFTAVLARWAGHDLDYLSTYVAPPLASVSSFGVAVGFVLPLVGQRTSASWRTWKAYRELGFLWRVLREAGHPDARPVRMAWWSSGELRITQRMADIHDGLLGLDPYFDHALRERTLAGALARGTDAESAAAEADAATVADALRAKAADPEGRVIGSADAYTWSRTNSRAELTRISVALRRAPATGFAEPSERPLPGADRRESSHT